MPLLANELLWSTGMTFLTQCYSTCGLDVVPAVNISTTLFNLTGVVFMSMGHSQRHPHGANAWLLRTGK